MRKKLLYLVALFTSFAMTLSAQECDSLTLTVGGGAWDSEIGWSIGETSGFAGTYDLCLEDGLYSFDMTDAYGDGWNGGTFSISDLEGNIIASGGLDGINDDGSAGSVAFTVGDVSIAGCTDPMYLEYDAVANLDDGTCVTLIVEGCTDENADNFDANANVSSGCEYSCPFTADGTDYMLGDCYYYVWEMGWYDVEGASAFVDCSCVEDPIYGCLDETADNYNADADLDGPCEYTVTCADNETEVSVMMMDSWGDGWDTGTLVVGDNTLSLPSGSEGSATLCLVDGVYDVSAGGSSYDSEMSWTISMGEDTLAGGSPYSGSLVVGDVAVPGCTDAAALNYNPLATEDDESCEYPVPCDLDEVTVNLYDSFGDGGGQITVDGNVLTNAGSSNSMTVCIDLSACTAVDYLSTDSWSYENSWDVTDASGAVLASGADASGNVGTCAVLGCTDETAFNYNPIATEDDGSCMEIVEGCIDNTAFNYNPAANTDNGSCIYVGCPDGTTSATVTLGGGTYDGEISAVITSPNGQVDLSGGAGTYDVCLSPDSLYTAVLTDSFGDGWNGATFTVTTCDGELIAATGTVDAGTDSTITFTIQSCDSYVWGCMDMNAANYDEAATADDGSCSYPGCTDPAYAEFDDGANVDDGSCMTLVVEGCIDETALNLDPEANTDDGSCEYAIACEDGLSGIEVSMVDSYGDGWNGNVLSLSNTAGEVVATGTIDAGTDSTITVCVTPGCYNITVDGGSWQGEVSWAIATTEGGAPALEGGAPSVSYLSIGSDDSCSEDNFAVGCMDPWASNYDADATSAGECNYPLNADCDVAIEMLFDTDYSGSSLVNQWFTFTTESSDVVLSSEYTDPYTDVEFFSTVLSACDGDTLTGALDAGTYIVHVNNNYGSSYNIDYTAVWNLAAAVEGCMDSYATNYDTLANVAGECLYECDGIAATLTVTASELYAAENAFDLLSGEGEIVASGGFVDAYANGEVVEIPLCLESGMTYTMNTYDSYGDGWTGYGEDGGYSITYDCDNGPVLAASNFGMDDPASVAVDGYHLESSDVFTLIACSDIAFGCMDEVADNYDASANMDDGSCIYLGCMDMNFVEYDPSATVDDGTCVTPSCGDGTELVSITVGGGFYDSEISWSITDCDGIQIISGLAPFAIDTCLALPEGYVINMVDSYGDGWNGALLTLNGDEYGLDSGSEGAAVVGECGGYGCTNPDAANYDMDATDDDGSCEFECPLNASGEVYNVTVDTAGFTIYNCYYYIWESQYDYTIEEIEGYGYDCSCVEAPVLGCMDMEADNYDPLATQNAGCEYTVLCDEDQQQVTVTMIDSWGDGWNGNVLTIMSEDSVASMDYTIEAGAYGTADACIDMSGCNTITVGGGSFATEVSWTITDLDGATLAEGGAPDTLFVGTCYIDGCTDETALNYDPIATVDDGTCIAIVEGCMNDAYAEYNSDANVDDGSCATLLCAANVVSLSVGGGTWDGEISWTLGENSGVAGDYDLCLEDGCFEFMMADSFGDGWNGASAVFTMDGVELLTATIESGDSGMALVSVNGDCGVLGCTDASAANYNADATEDDGSCQYEGCMDPSADNYDPTATVDDGSCMFSCEDGTAQVDILITTDNYANETAFTLTDGQGGVYTISLTSAQNTQTVTSTFCVDNNSDMTFVITDSYGDGIINGGYEIYVCQESIYSDFNMGMYDAVSYEFTAVCGDVMGCMDSNALNFDADATMEDGSCEYPCTDLEAVVTISTVSFAYEMEWSLEDAAGNQIAGEGGLYDNNAVYEIAVCLEDGADYNFNMADSYGDGWNGGTFSVSADCGELAAGGLENGEAGQVSFTADCGGSTDCEAPASWDVTITGSNHTIMIPGDALITDANGESVANAVVGVFFTNSNGDLQCAGYTAITGETVQIAAMGDDTTTDEIDGLSAGDDLVWMMWNCDAGEAIDATATYSGGVETFTTNGLTFVASIAGVPAGPSCQTIDMPSGWSMFSTYMIAEDMDLAAVLAPIVDNVIIAKNNSGDAYLVQWDFNGIGEMVVGQGYQIKTDAPVSLEICGDYAFPEDNAIDIIAGWNMIGYLRTEGADAAAVLGDINASGNLIIAKDYNGNAYLPEWDFNGIGNMEPGQGYQLKTEDVDVLEYLSNDESYRLSSIEVTENNVSHFSKVVPTDNNMTVVIEDASWDVLPTEGSEVAAFDKAGNLIGSAIYSSPVTVLTVWGDDVMTSEKEGSLVSESVSFKVFTSGDVRDFTVTEWAEGSSTYLVDAINVASSIEINTVVADADSSDRVLVKVINVLGQEVELNDESFKGEVLFNVYDDGSVEQFVK